MSLLKVTFKTDLDVDLGSIWRASGYQYHPMDRCPVKKVDPETGIDFHMILCDFQARPLAEDIHLVGGKLMIQGRYNNQQYGDRML